MIRQLAGRFSTVVKEEGIAIALAKAAKAVSNLFRRISPDHFDTTFNTETSRAVPLWRLRVPSKNAKFGSKYQTTDPSVFLGALSMVPANLQSFTFIDLGCGKGRTLILAAKHGFRKVMGVEFSPELAAIARQNVEQVGIAAEVIEGDASKFDFADGNLLIYMYNPFGRSVMHSVVVNLTHWRARHENDAFLVYINPVCRGEIESSGAMESLVNSKELGIWKLR